MNTPERPPRSRRRLWLLAALLAALVALLVQRPGLRDDAGTWLAARAVDTLHVSPRDLYGWRLRAAGLGDTALVRRWRSTPERSEPQRLTDTLAAAGNFEADRIAARVYARRLARGERVLLRLRAGGDGRLFATLERRGNDGWTSMRALTADSDMQAVTIADTGRYRLVLQPELGAAPRFELTAAVGGSLAFPVADADAHDIGSGFGAPREGGARAHHGVDIFADRGTPVTAVAAGRVRTGSQGIGGNHVWLSSGRLSVTGPRYYYAHLDRFAVASGDRVEAGDVLGYVGNTGNARTTPPHLHFGIYTVDGPVDPAPYLEPAPELPAN